MTRVAQELDRVVREERTRLVATLVRLLGDWDRAEELVHDAMVSALETWPRDGMPRNPGAWLATTARRRAIDRLRRERRFQQLAEELARETPEAGSPDVPMTPSPPGGDDRLRLIFTCCHPALSQEAQVALTLRTIAGLTTPEIARAFLVPESTIAQRLVRAKRKIAAARIPYRVPDRDELAPRLDAVLAVLYLIFNEGYLTTAGPEAERRELATQAAWLTSLVVELLPAASEAVGLLALMRLHLARADARFTPEGDLVLLADQDRSSWNRTMIRDAAHLLDRALEGGDPGPFTLQAAIVAEHAVAPTFEATDWARIVTLYDALAARAPSPVVALNRAVAIGQRDGPAEGLAALEALDERLAGYHLYHAARGEHLRRLGRHAEAGAAFRRAADATHNVAERRFLEARLAERA